ncbi:MAG TPA: hypothetical protein VEA69_06060 [Tepidisphaeraceae bacterium]|nr:hypothetical protein [Tepidisphaeraceae bacterium]
MKANPPKPKPRKPKPAARRVVEYVDHGFAGSDTTGYSKFVARGASVVRFHGCSFSGGLWIDVDPGTTVEIIECTFADLRFPRGGTGHAIIINGLLGSDPRDCVIRLKIKGNRIVCGEGSNVEDAISLCSVQGTAKDRLLVVDNVIAGHLDNGGGRETAICIDRNVAWFKVMRNTIDVVSRNVAINSAGGSHGVIASNEISGGGVGSAINAYNHYGRFGDTVEDVKVRANRVAGAWAGDVWVDLSAVPANSEG